MQVIDVIRLGKARRLEKYEQVVPAIILEGPTSYQNEIEELLYKVWGISMSCSV